MSEIHGFMEIVKNILEKNFFYGEKCLFLHFIN